MRLHSLGAVLTGLALCFACPAPVRADSCNTLTVRLIRGTGAALAERSGSLVLFRAIDADRMSLTCGKPPRLLLRSDWREPPRSYFILVGLAATTLAGTSTESAEALALRLHQDSLLTGEPQLGRSDGIVIRCEPGDRPDGLSAGTLCHLAPDRPHRRTGLSRRKGRG